MTISNSYKEYCENLPTPMPTLKKSLAGDDVHSYLGGYLHIIATKIIEGAFSRNLVAKNLYIEQWNRSRVVEVPREEKSLLEFFEKIPFIVNDVRVKVEKKLEKAVEISQLIDAIAELTLRDGKAKDKLEDYSFEELENIAYEIIGDSYLRTLIGHVYDLRLIDDPNFEEIGGRTHFPETEEEIADFREKVPLIILNLQDQVERKAGYPVRISELVDEAAKMSTILCGYLY